LLGDRVGRRSSIDDIEAAMAQAFRFCNGTYLRDEQGVWRYPWGSPVPGATDLTLADLLQIDPDAACDGEGFRPLTSHEREWLAGRCPEVEEVLVRRRGSRAPDAGDLIVGMAAPELHALALMTVGDVARVAGVSKATIDSYRSRGSLPPPQVVRGRTPLWARPIISHWLANRPGSGWRSDLYGDDAEDTTAGGSSPQRLSA
jgi:predicted DNA-binding transcriptional regulator AlpA